VLEGGPEWLRLRRSRRLDAEAETARETENLEIWGGESVGVLGAVRENQGAGGAVRQKFRFSGFQRGDAQKILVSGKKRPN